MSKDTDSIQEDIEAINKDEYIDAPKEVQLIKELISTLQGAPYPTSVNDELYAIWYEHSLIAINNAYAFINKPAQPEEETEIP